jgi:ribosomal protein L32
VFKSMRADGPRVRLAVREPVLFKSVLHDRETGVALTMPLIPTPFHTAWANRVTSHRRKGARQREMSVSFPHGLSAKSELGTSEPPSNTQLFCGRTRVNSIDNSKFRMCN